MRRRWQTTLCNELSSRKWNWLCERNWVNEMKYWANIPGTILGQYIILSHIWKWIIIVFDTVLTAWYGWWPIKKKSFYCSGSTFYAFARNFLPSHWHIQVIIIDEKCTNFFSKRNTFISFQSIDIKAFCFNSLTNNIHRMLLFLDYFVVFPVSRFQVPFNVNVINSKPRWKHSFNPNTGG